MNNIDRYKYYHLYFRIDKWYHDIINCRYDNDKSQWQYPILLKENKYKPFPYAQRIIEKWEDLPLEAHIYAIIKSSVEERYYYGLV